jgi:DNA-nicking Smr family endonuclease
MHEQDEEVCVVDLHGYTTLKAKSILKEYLDSGEYTHLRVITGTGVGRSEGPILRTFITNFLRDEGICFHFAEKYNGGEGALEVYL